MATRLYGTLRDGLGKPIINATVALLAKGNTITVLAGSEAIFKTDSQGAYNITVQTGYYKVIIGPQGIEPYKAGEIAIYADSKEGSLNSYLTSWAPEELTPEVIAQVKELVANSLRLRSENPTISFVESDASESTYLFVADGGNFRLNRDTTAGAELFSYSRSQNNLKLGVSSYFTLNTRFDQGWTSKGSVDVTTTGYSTVSVITTSSTDAVGARNQFEVNPSTNQFYLARRNRSNLTGQLIINFPSAGGTLALSATSDINYKTNIEEYDGLHSVENIKAMELVTFVFKDDERKRVRRGVIAQQIEQIDPTYVKRTYEPCGEAIVDENGIVQGYSEEKERVVLENNVILLDCLCALQVLIKRDEEKTQELDKLKQEVLELKNTVKDLVNAINGDSNNTQLP